ncbi:MAG: flavohemoglobin expression-modulating QEGLA motif protein [Candidatus Saccharibacteria bacterium]|nr:flavohemoglobin expression-modulating QEGLA motif protein [Candidatus Saccharibacteria bacterium]
MQYEGYFDYANLAEIMLTISPTNIVGATNVAKEKDRWIRAARNGFFFQPNFSYDRKYLKRIASQREELEKAKEVIKRNLIPEIPIEEAIKDILLNRIYTAITFTEIAASILLGDDEHTCRLNCLIYVGPNSNQAIRAYNIVDHEIELPLIKSRFSSKECKRLSRRKFHADDIKYWFEKAIEYYGITGWTVEIGDHHAVINVSDKNSTGTPIVGIPTDRVVDGMKLLELIGHEIETHLVGNENCKALIAEIIGPDSPLMPLCRIIAKSDDKQFSEGVAKISDVSIRGTDGLPKPYATIACDLARRGASFKEVAQVLYHQMIGMGQNEKTAVIDAWTTTYRIIRGCTDPSKGGYYFAKDFAYMRGYEVAQTVNPNWHNFSCLAIEDLSAIASACELNPKYAKLDAVGYIKEQLLSD